MTRTRWIALLLLSLGACDAPKREELTGLQQRLDALVAEQGELRKQTDSLTEELRKQKEASETQASALQATKTELAALQAQVTALAVKPPEPVRPIAVGKPDPTVRYAVALGDSAIEGSADAKVTIVIFSDFQCPFCARVQDTLDELQRSYGADLRVVAKHNPLSFHTSADGAARAAEAAGKQGKFWEMHDKLYANIKALGQSDLESYAKELGLDVAQFRRDMDDATIRARIDADIKQAKELGAAGTPSFFINGKYIAGAQPAASFRTIIDAEIVEADRLLAAGTARSGVYGALMATAKPGVAAGR
jgi:protein-disulfide isomerase